MAGLASRLLALHELHARHILTDDQFARAKQRVIAEHQETPPPPAAPVLPSAPPPPAPGRAAPPPTLNPVVPGVGLALGAAAGGMGG